MLSDLGLMEMRIESLFTFDVQARMLRTNEPEGRTAPRLFWGRTMEGDLWRFGQEVSPPLASRLSDLVEAERVASDLRVVPACRLDILAVLEEQAPVLEVSAGPAYGFPSGIRLIGDPVAITPANAHLVKDGFPWLVPELQTQQPCFAVVRDGYAVSICRCSRVGARAAEAGVETLEQFRGRGYATAVTAAWAANVREHGLVPLYSTSWENIASQGVAQRLGLILYGTDLSIW